MGNPRRRASARRAERADRPRLGASGATPAYVKRQVPFYEFLGEELYQHNFENVEYDAPEFDAQLGLDGLHRVHRKVEIEILCSPQKLASFKRAGTSTLEDKALGASTKIVDPLLVHRQ